MDLIAFLGQTEAPWSAALIGTLIGGLITWFTSRSNDRRRAKREDARRWDEDIRRYGSDFLELCDQHIKGAKEYSRESRRVHNCVDKEAVEKQHKPDRDRAGTAIDSASTESRRVINELSFIAPDSVLSSVNGHYVKILKARITGLVEQDEMDTELNKSRQSVVNEIRKGISLPKSRVNRRRKCRRRKKALVNFFRPGADPSAKTKGERAA